MVRYMLRPYYRISPGVNIFVEYEYQKNYGAFKFLQNSAGESIVQNTLTFGFSLVF